TRESILLPYTTLFQSGKELFVDWMGDTLDCVIDSVTGELKKAYFFVATLGDSSYPYVEAFPDQKLDKWLLAHVNCLNYLGGVPKDRKSTRLNSSHVKI